jgi:hypothetical protein
LLENGSMSQDGFIEAENATVCREYAQLAINSVKDGYL